MTQFYTDQSKEEDKWSLPNAEVWFEDGSNFDPYDGESLTTGYYWWYCFPGCLPESEPIGPFKTEDEAIEEARENG